MTIHTVQVANPDQNPDTLLRRPKTPRHQVHALNHLFSTNHSSKRYILLYNKVLVDLAKSTKSSSLSSLPSNQNFKQQGYFTG